MAEDSSRGAATWSNGIAKQLTWEADGKSYSPTGLANRIFTSVTGRKADGIQGTTWWDVDTSRVPDMVDPDYWAALAGLSLVHLAKQLSGSGKDWTTLHRLLASLASPGTSEGRGRHTPDCRKCGPGKVRRHSWDFPRALRPSPAL
ncbi:hypothetical protein [Streptomyces sirii]|uniref:hypothetical protein n=1 Tax=Streptomyces sirii TaxID=3127701 RepID=UPI003D3640D6